MRKILSALVAVAVVIAATPARADESAAAGAKRAGERAMAAGQEAEKAGDKAEKAGEVAQKAGDTAEKAESGQRSPARLRSTPGTGRRA